MAKCFVRQWKYIISLVIFMACCFASFGILSYLENGYGTDIDDFTYANNVTGFEHPIVPNVVHFVQFGSREISFIQAVSIKSVYLNQRPEKIIIHCDCYSLGGKYWDLVKNISILEVRYMRQPAHIFGRKFNNIYHVSDIARLQLLMEEGGIFLDGDCYVVKSLDYYRKFEMSIGWPRGAFLGNQVIIAHKNARFLKLWYNSYENYQGEKWYYNAGELPTTSILYPNPGLVHRVANDFGVHNLVNLLYGGRSSDWQNYDCIHLLARHKHYFFPNDSVREFDEENIKHYDKTFGEMARIVIYGTTDFVD